MSSRRSGRVRRAQDAARARRVVGSWLLLALVLLVACAAPIRVEPISPRKAQQELTRSILTGRELSEKARILLRRTDQERAWEREPARVLAEFHEALSEPRNEFDVELRASLMDAVAELAFAHARRTGDRAYYLAAALYAYLYLMPADPDLRPSPVDRGVRLSADIYNRSLALGLADPETGELRLEDAEYPLPFGTLEVDFDESTRRLGDRDLEHPRSVADLEVIGLNNRYRRSGLGAPLAARLSPPAKSDDPDPIFSEVRVAATALLALGALEDQLREKSVRGRLLIFPYTDQDAVEIGGKAVPLEVETSATLALMLTEAPPWRQEIEGFFQGDLAQGDRGLFSLSPFRPDRIPFVLVHGTASSAGRWADLINDLGSDPALARHYQFWLFSYNTGNPISYSGWLLRKDLRDLVESLDPEGRNPLLRDLVVMGHSQGGLLTKLQVVDSGDRFWNLVSDRPPDEIELSPESRELLQGSLLVEPSPFVRRVIFLSTPHRGSRLADLGPARLLGRLVRAPANIVTAVGDLFQDDEVADVQRRLRRGAGAIGNMSPSSEFIQTLADLPIAPGVHAHSIMGVKKGPKEEGGDGVVSYESAHLDDVESERVVQSGHSSQSNPRVVAEVRRILIEHLQEAIERGIVSP